MHTIVPIEREPTRGGGRNQDRCRAGRIAANGSQLSEMTLDQLRRITLAKSFQISIDTLDPAVPC
ncbi:MAG: hypothetical protein QGG69_05625 [Kiritimatiellia bacterium]|jgi:hypothetical protein|nr:hypothetical protein [Kiritimatiellia bacterium]